MKLAHLQFAPGTVLAPSQALYRVQYSRARPGTVKLGKLRLPPVGLMNGRFDLPNAAVAYFAEAPETAVYETLARREKTALSMATLKQRSLLCFQTLAPLQLLDLRPHATSFPVLQSLRFAQTQELAIEVERAGYEGIVYRSSQQFGMDCYALFPAALARLRPSWSEALVKTGTDDMHRVLVAAILGSKLPLVP